MTLESLFRAHLPGLRMRALAISENAVAAELLVRSVHLHGERNAAELLAHPNPRGWLLSSLERVLEPWRAQAWSMLAMDASWSTTAEASW